MFQGFLIGGEGEIRTLERFYPLHDFQSCALDQARRLLHNRDKLSSSTGNSLPQHIRFVKGENAIFFNNTDGSHSGIFS